MGDSRGRWEGNTLVVDTTNFTDKTSFRGSGANLHVVERFTRIDADTLEYRFTVDDPTTWTRPWTVAYPMVKTDGPIYEYACHEGNYGLVGILAGRALRGEETVADMKPIWNCKQRLQSSDVCCCRRRASMPPTRQHLARESFGVERRRLARCASERDQNFLLTSAAGDRYVLKIANATEDRAMLEAQNAAMAHVASAQRSARRCWRRSAGESIASRRAGTISSGL